MFAKRLKELRIERQISQTELATVLNISNRTISMYEKGYSEPNVETLINIAKFFDVSTDYLIGITNSRNPDNRNISDTLNLSDDAVNILKELPLTISKKNGISLSDILNALVVNPEFIHILKSILLYISRTQDDWGNFQKFLSEQCSIETDINEAKKVSETTISNYFSSMLHDILNNKIETYNMIEITSDKIQISPREH